MGLQQVGSSGDGLLTALCGCGMYFDVSAPDNKQARRALDEEYLRHVATDHRHEIAPVEKYASP